jgi:hypothetical protein
MSEFCNRAAFWRLWRTLGKAVWAVWMHMQDGGAEDSHRKGSRFEREFKQMAIDRQLVVEKGVGRADCCISGLKTQCKAIDRYEGGIDIANMRAVQANNGVRGYLRSEIDVMALRHRSRLFIIPADYLQRDNGVLKPKVRLKEIEQFENNWSVFDTDYVPPPRDKQLPLL